MQEPSAETPTDGDEDLFSVTDHPNAAKHEVRKTFARLRPVTHEETDQSEAAERLLGRMTIQSGYAELRQAQDILFEEIGRIRTELGGSVDRHRQAARLQREFKAWLSAFRAFDDRTSKWLSDEVGKSSSAYDEFKVLLSHEFDNNFGYRLCCALRNVSEHQADVINDLRFHVGLNPESGQSETSLTMRFDGPRLAAESSGIRAATRAELKGCQHPLELEWVIRSVILSCQQVHSGLFLALWPEIQSAIATVGEAHREATEAGGEWAVFIMRSAYAGTTQGRSQMTMRPNAYELGVLATQNHAQSIATRGAPLGRLEPSDFMA